MFFLDLRLPQLNTIKGKIIILLLLALVALIATSGFILYSSWYTKNQLLEKTLDEKALSNATILEEKMQAEINVITTISHIPQLVEEDIYTSLAYLNEMFKAQTALGTLVITFGLLDLEGNLWEAAEPERVTPRGDTGWFKAIAGGAELAISAPGFSAAYPDIMRVVIVVPVYKDGQLYRVLHARLGLNALSALMPDLKYGEKGRAFLLDQQGIMIAHPKADLLLKDATIASEQIPAIVADALRQAVTEKSGQVAYTFKGVPSIVAYQPIANTGWIMVTVADQDEFLAPVKSLVLSAVVVIVLVALLLLILGWYTGNKITGPIIKLNVAAGRLAEGNLNVEIKAETSDETGQLAETFEKMRLNLKELIGNTAIASAKVSETAKSLVEQAEQTAAAATENASSVSEISATVENVADNIKTVSEQALVASEQGDKSRQDIAIITQTMQEIEQSVGKGTVSVNDLSKSIEQVGQFVEVINGIAGQTNLLSLNAAIEAARAGEAGKGFAVVAEEVRKLAESSSRSAEEINRIIAEVQQQSEQAAADMATSREKVAEGDQVVQQVNQSLGDIMQLVQDVSQKAQDVSAAAGEMSEATQNVAATTEQQTATMEEVSASAAELSNTAVEMDQALAKYK